MKICSAKEGSLMEKWIVDKDHSTIGFEVKHMMVSNVRGQFDSFKVKIEAEDITDLTTAKIEFHIDVDSIHTRNLIRDKHLKSLDFFDIENYPMLHFQSTNIEKNGESYKITGDLTIKDTTKPVIFDVIYGGKATDPLGQEVYGYEAETIINREEFGLTWNAALETGGVLVGNEVKIKAELELYHSSSDISRSTRIEMGALLNQVDGIQETINKDFNQMLAQNITDFVTIINRNGDIQYVSPSFKTILSDNFSLREKNNFFDKVHQEDQEALKSEIITNSGRIIRMEFTSEFRLLHKDGYYMDVEANIIGIQDESIPKENELILIVMRNISERKDVEKSIYRLAFRDSLTNLPNRRSFMNKLRTEMVDKKLSKSKLSVFFIDLDNFKQINDQWGHDTGDTVLKEASRRIRSVIRPTDIAARFGGDEFVVLLKDVREREDAITIAKRILMEFQNPIKIMDQDYQVTSSIGVAYYPDHGESPEELIKNADTALYDVKERGKSDFGVFDRQLEHTSLERRILENALRQGIKEQQFYLEYQPKINMKSNKLIGMEALARWKHPELGVISPGKFIPLAEETGLIVPLGEWILKKGCRQISEWDEVGYPPLNLSINVSVIQLENMNFIEKLKTILNDTGVDPKRLELEITESALANITSITTVLKEIRKLGISISIDDFGTGYSSLSYIKDLPIDTLKIDQSFIRDIHNNKESKEIAKAIVRLASSIGLNVIAEGVELEEHVDELNKGGCILGQGYYFSRPLSVDAFEKYMITAIEAS